MTNVPNDCRWVPVTFGAGSSLSLGTPEGRDGTIATFFSFVKGPVFLVNPVGNIDYRLLGELADYCKWIKLH